MLLRRWRDFFFVDGRVIAIIWAELTSFKGDAHAWEAHLRDTAMLTVSDESYVYCRN